jgi:hypothetical protein
MSSKAADHQYLGRAEKSFRDAFDRLKRNEPEVLPKGTRVSQNNVAKEASCDPSALKKSRYLSLVTEIQRWNEQITVAAEKSPRQAALAQRAHNRSLRGKIEALKAQRDIACSLLLEADAKVMYLLLENDGLKSLQPTSKITPIRG